MKKQNTTKIQPVLTQKQPEQPEQPTLQNQQHPSFQKEGVKSNTAEKDGLDLNQIIATELQKMAQISDNTLDLPVEEEYHLATFWSNRLQSTLKVYEPYYQVIKKARKVYKSGANITGEGAFLSSLSDSGYNIFWSGIETQKPFLYFKQPKPYVERLSWNMSFAEKVAAKILERALIWNLNKFDFDSVLKYARNDYLISGCGILWETYCPSFQTGSLFNQEITLKTDEKVVSTYVDPLNFLMDTTHAGIFEEVSWISRRLSIAQKDIFATFGAKAYEMVAQKETSSLEEEARFIDVYEIWDKETKRVYYLSLDYPSAFLSIKNDPLHLEGFFPIPKPIFASLTNDSLIPQADYQMVEKILEELKGTTDRMRLLMQAIKISGVYDTSFSRLKDIFDKDITLVGLHDFDRLKEAGGLKGVIDFIPISQYISALEVLSKRRDELKNELFEITGVSDIMRGSSQKVETATAVQKKTGFGTLRNQDRQNDMQRFIQNAYQIKAEIICEHFDADLLKSFVSQEEKIPLDVLAEAIAILKTGKLRNMILSIETEAFFNPDFEASKTATAVELISKLITQGIQAVSNEPNLLPLYKTMICHVASSLPHARQFENVIEQSFQSISEAVEKAKQNEDFLTTSFLLNPKKQAHQQALENLKADLSKASLRLKQKELAFQERELFYKSKKAELDFYETLMKTSVEGQKSRLKYGKSLPKSGENLVTFPVPAKPVLSFLKKGIPPFVGEKGQKSQTLFSKNTTAFGEKEPKNNALTSVETQKASATSNPATPSLGQKESATSNPATPSLGQKESTTSSSATPSLGQKANATSSPATPSLGQKESASSSSATPSLGQKMAQK